VKNIANVYVPTAVALPSAWNLSYTPVTTTDFLGHLRTYTPSADAPGCVPMQKAIATATFLADTVNPWGTVANPWPATAAWPSPARSATHPRGASRTSAW
jgi:hypothetical protein